MVVIHQKRFSYSSIYHMFQQLQDLICEKSIIIYIIILCIYTHTLTHIYIYPYIYMARGFFSYMYVALQNNVLAYRHFII